MISLCVHSKNRPLQLDLFLQSVERNAPYVSDVHVLYFADEPFRLGYEVLAERWPSVKFHLETAFVDQTLELVEGFNPYFLWSTDDSVFIRELEITEDDLRLLFGIDQVRALNLRMGENIQWQNHWFQTESRKLDITGRFHNKFITWNALDHPHDCDPGRVWQNDASIMPRDSYLARLKEESGWRHNKCRSLDTLAQSGRIMKDKNGEVRMAAPNNSVYLNVPVNLVHYLDDGRLYADNWGKFRRYDILSLQQKFDEGLRIDLDHVINQCEDLTCGRKEVEYKFV